MLPSCFSRDIGRVSFVESWHADPVQLFGSGSGFFCGILLGFALLSMFQSSHEVCVALAMVALSASVAVRPFTPSQFYTYSTRFAEGSAKGLAMLGKRMYFIHYFHTNVETFLQVMTS